MITNYLYGQSIITQILSASSIAILPQSKLYVGRLISMASLQVVEVLQIDASDSGTHRECKKSTALKLVLKYVTLSLVKTLMSSLVLMVTLIML
jgi:hypothetical protein